MKKYRLKFLIATAALLMLGIPLWAHHGNAAYDDKNPITIKGTVTEFAWTNPHVQIYLDVKDDKGGVVHWSVETYSPGKLIRAGWTKDSIKAGRSSLHQPHSGKERRARGFSPQACASERQRVGPPGTGELSALMPLRTRVCWSSHQNEIKNCNLSKRRSFRMRKWVMTLTWIATLAAMLALPALVHAQMPGQQSRNGKE